MVRKKNPKRERARHQSQSSNASNSAAAAAAAAAAARLIPHPPGAGAAPAAAPGIPAPTPVPGFSTGSDLAQINDFLLNYSTSIEDVDNQLADLKSDTAFQKTGNDKQAKGATVQTADEMAGRGIFQSSVKDAALYDIEAQRALSNKFLDDKLTSATLQAGTRKRTLADAKKRFDEAMLARQGENAAGVNDAANTAWAAQQAAAPAPAPAAPAAKPYREQPGQDSNGNPGVWHIYPNGRKVFVRK